MNPAVWPRSEPELERMLVVGRASGAITHARIGELPRFLSAGDLVVVNDAATLPASLVGRTASGDELEARLYALDVEHGLARALVFGAGSWRTPTERRGPAPPLALGESVVFAAELPARVRRLLGPRRVELRLGASGALLLRALYAAGRPVQYSYLAGRLALWHVTTRFASRPWAFEMPSAGRPLAFGTLLALRRRGVEVAALTHAAGLSSTGSPELDAELPGPEPYEIPERTRALVERARREGGRVIAVGTSVVRALEDSALRHGAPRAGSGTAELRLSAAHPLRVVDGLLTGIHEPGTSHFELLEAFASRAALEASLAQAVRAGYLGHELGDSCLLLPDAESAPLAA